METATVMQHGVNAYAKGRCRCEECREAWNGYQRAYKARRRTVTVSRRYFVGETEGAQVRLTRLGRGIAQARAAQTGYTVDDIVEATLRDRGASVDLSPLAD